MTKKDHWETRDDVKEFMAKQIERLGFPDLYEMEGMTSPKVSDSVLSLAMRGQFDPKVAKRKTIEGIRSLEKAKGATTTRHRCPTCGGWYYEVEKK